MKPIGGRRYFLSDFFKKTHNNTTNIDDFSLSKIDDMLCHSKTAEFDVSYQDFVLSSSSLSLGLSALSLSLLSAAPSRLYSLLYISIASITSFVVAVLIVIGEQFENSHCKFEMKFVQT